MRPVPLVHAQVTLQHDTLEGVVAGDAYYGATIGRVCNRVAGASFSGESPHLRAHIWCPPNSHAAPCRRSPRAGELPQRRIIACRFADVSLGAEVSAAGVCCFHRGYPLNTGEIT